MEYLFAHLNKSSIVDGSFLGERLKEWHIRADAPFKDLYDDVHATRLYLKHDLLELFHEFSQGFIFLHFYVLQSTYILFVSC